jgi:hypothetical protein
MANELTLPPPPKWLTLPGDRRELNKELTANVGESYPVLSIRSGKFFIRYQGVEMPYNSLTIDVVLIRSKEELVKAWYIKGYQAGDRAAPDCFSTDGKSPDPDAPNTPIDERTGQRMQFCSVCPNNQFKTAVGKPDGKGGTIGGGGKACADGRRVVILLPDGVFPGGEVIPVLLRIPPTSLKPLATYGRNLDLAGYTMFAVKTRLSFASHDEKGNAVGHPLLKFDGIEVLPQDQYEFAKKLRTDPLVERMLNAKVDGVNADVHRPDLQDKIGEAGYMEVPSTAADAQPPAEPAPVAPAPPPEPTVLATLPDGRLVMSDGTFRAPAPPPPPPPPAYVIVATLPDGRRVTDKGEFLPPEGPAPAQAAPPAAVVPLRPTPPAPTEALPPAPTPGPVPGEAEVRAKLGRPKSVKAKPEAAPPADVASPEPATEKEDLPPQGNGTDKIVGAVPPGLDSIIGTLKGSGV